MFSICKSHFSLSCRFLTTHFLLFHLSQFYDSIFPRRWKRSGEQTNCEKKNLLLAIELLAQLFRRFISLLYTILVAKKYHNFFFIFFVCLIHLLVSIELAIPIQMLYAFMSFDLMVLLKAMAHEKKQPHQCIFHPGTDNSHS